MRRTLSYYILANKTVRKYLQKQTHRETEGLSLRPLYQTSPSIMEENDVAGSVTGGFQQESRLPLSLFLSLSVSLSLPLYMYVRARSIFCDIITTIAVAIISLAFLTPIALHHATKSAA